MPSVLDRLVASLRAAASFHSETQAAPACVLWPDGEEQWAGALPRLREAMPELYQLGEYRPQERTGPAIWLRCVVAGFVDGEGEAAEGRRLPVLYLPKVARHEILSVDACPEAWKPLVELQYRSSLWVQGGGKDWTLPSWVRSRHGGLGLDVSRSRETGAALQLALPRLLDEEVELLDGKHLDGEFLHALLAGRDPVRDLLLWIEDPEGYRAGKDEASWKGFVEVCQSQLGFDPEREGAIVGAARLAGHAGPWKPVWERFCEAPTRYPGVPAQIRRSPLPGDLFSDRTGWPQWNEEQEDGLRKVLVALASQAGDAARRALLEAEAEHGPRRETVWAELGDANLARALEHLAVLAGGSDRGPPGGTAEEQAAAFFQGGWRLDAAAIQALAAVRRPEDRDAVGGALRAIYLPWCDEAARRLQEEIGRSGYPEGAVGPGPEAAGGSGECWLFVDGLRLDAARRMEDQLRGLGATCEMRAAWAALPSVTATGKPAVAPVASLVRGDEGCSDFAPSVSETGKPAGPQLRKLLAGRGWQVLQGRDLGDANGRGWTEIGDLDHEGHDRGAALAAHLERLLQEVAERILQLLRGGWRTVRVVTDHGWLLVPGGLPKVELPAALVESKWGRCASLKEGAVSRETLFPWYWNPAVTFALAPGVACYRSGVEYAHGGLSLQECVTPELVVSLDSIDRAGAVVLREVRWKGLRCKVRVEGEVAPLMLDVRTHAPAPETSLVMDARVLRPDGTGSVVIEDEEREGQAAYVVIVTEDGRVVAQQATIIGEEG